MGFGLTIISLFAFIPSPIFFGWILDRSCIVWGKTCSGSGNCWLYDGESLRYTLNTIASVFIFLGVIFDAGVWYSVKGLQIFDASEPKYGLNFNFIKSRFNRKAPTEPEPENSLICK